MKNLRKRHSPRALFMRVSVPHWASIPLGIEDVNDIIADLEQALKAIS